MDGYRALLIGNSHFPADPQNLQELQGPVKDVALLGAALTDRDAGLFDNDHVRLMVERPVGRLLEEIEAFMCEARRDDHLLLYYSGHGLLDERNQLYLAASTTRIDRLRSTAVSAGDISEMLDNSAARTAVILLDCCHSGAFKGSIGPANLAGSGRFVLTSCRSGELANDADRRNGTSLFTQHLVDGLMGGAPDLDGDGRVDVDEVYRYVHDRLAETNRQIPQRRFDGSARTPALARRAVREAPVLPPATGVSEPGSATLSETPPAAVSPDRTGALPEVQTVRPAEPEVTLKTSSTYPMNDSPRPSSGAKGWRAAGLTRLGGWGRRRLVLACAVLACVLVGAALVVVSLSGGESVKTPPPPVGPAMLKGPKGIFVDPGGNLYIADSGNNRVVRVTAAGQSVTTVAGTDKASGFFPGIAATDASLDNPEGIAPAAGGGFYIVDYDPNVSGKMRLFSVGQDQALNPVPTKGPLSRSLSPISAVVADARTGLVYVANDTRVLRLDPKSGDLTPVMGTDERGYSGDGGPPADALLDGVEGLALDPTGKKLYVADCRNGRVRAVDLANNVVTTLAGRPGGSNAEGVRATDARLSCPTAVAAGTDGAVYLIDNLHVRKVINELITTVAGAPENAPSTNFTDDGRLATQTTFTQLQDIAVDAQDRIYLSDGISRVRLIDQKGIVSTYA